MLLLAVRCVVWISVDGLCVPAAPYWVTHGDVCCADLLGGMCVPAAPYWVTHGDVCCVDLLSGMCVPAAPYWVTHGAVCRMDLSVDGLCVPAAPYWVYLVGSGLCVCLSVSVCTRMSQNSRLWRPVAALRPLTSHWHVHCAGRRGRPAPFRLHVATREQLGGSIFPDQV